MTTENPPDLSHQARTVVAALTPELRIALRHPDLAEWHDRQILVDLGLGWWRSDARVIHTDLGREALTVLAEIDERAQRQLACDEWARADRRAMRGQRGGRT